MRSCTAVVQTVREIAVVRNGFKCFQSLYVPFGFFKRQKNRTNTCPAFLCIFWTYDNNPWWREIPRIRLIFKMPTLHDILHCRNNYGRLTQLPYGRENSSYAYYVHSLLQHTWRCAHFALSTNSTKVRGFTESCLPCYSEVCLLGIAGCLLQNPPRWNPKSMNLD